MSTFTLSNVTGFYQRHESKLILVVVVLLSIYLLAFLAQITWSMIPSPQNSTDSKTQQTLAANQNSSNANNSTNISSITNLKLFGDAESKPVVQVKEEVSEAPETKLNLLLSGVVASDNSKLGAAVIEYRNNQSTYGIGDKIEGTNVTLDEIYVDRVIIKNRLTRETLMLDGIDYDEANKKRSQQTSNNSQASQRQNTNDSSSSALQRNAKMREKAQALRNARAQLAKEPASFTDMISLAPHRVNNQLVGFRVSPGKSPTLFNSVGLKNGDVLIELNGLDLSDLQQSQEALGQLQSAELLLIQVLRDDEYVALELEIPDN